eukprot:jgi/Chrzof1/14364/Cz09g00040.t1
MLITVDAEATVPCSLTTSSPFFGAKVRSSSSAYVDQVPTWLKYGPLRALSLSYSTVSGCLLGVSATYGKTSVFSQGLGLFGNRQAGDVFQQLPLAQGERVTHIEIQSSTKCISFLKLITDHGNSISAGTADNGSHISKLPTLTTAGLYLVSIRGYHVLNAKTTTNALQQLQFVWSPVSCTAAALATPATALARQRHPPKPIVIEPAIPKDAEIAPALPVPMEPRMSDAGPSMSDAAAASLAAAQPGAGPAPALAQEPAAVTAAGVKSAVAAAQEPARRPAAESKHGLHSRSAVAEEHAAKPSAPLSPTVVDAPTKPAVERATATPTAASVSQHPVIQRLANIFRPVLEAARLTAPAEVKVNSITNGSTIDNTTISTGSAAGVELSQSAHAGNPSANSSSNDTSMTLEIGDAATILSNGTTSVLAPEHPANLSSSNGSAITPVTLVGNPATLLPHTDNPGGPVSAIGDAVQITNPHPGAPVSAIGDAVQFTNPHPGPPVSAIGDAVQITNPHPGGPMSAIGDAVQITNPHPGDSTPPANTTASEGTTGNSTSSTGSSNNSTVANTTIANISIANTSMFANSTAAVFSQPTKIYHSCDVSQYCDQPRPGYCQRPLTFLEPSASDKSFKKSTALTCQGPLGKPRCTADPTDGQVKDMSGLACELQTTGCKSFNADVVLPDPFGIMASLTDSGSTAGQTPARAAEYTAGGACYGKVVAVNAAALGKDAADYVGYVCVDNPPHVSVPLSKGMTVDIYPPAVPPLNAKGVPDARGSYLAADWAIWLCHDTPLTFIPSAMPKPDSQGPLSGVSMPHNNTAIQFADLLALLNPASLMDPDNKMVAFGGQLLQALGVEGINLTAPAVSPAAFSPLADVFQRLLDRLGQPTMSDATQFDGTLFGVNGTKVLELMRTLGHH